MAKQTITGGAGVLWSVTKAALNSMFDELYGYFQYFRVRTNNGVPTIINGDSANSVDSAVDTCLIAGGGRVSFPNHIGVVAAPAGSDNTNPISWAADSGYPAGAAIVATIGGGYDHINNQIAGTICGGGHHFIQYNVNGHSFIGGGSYNWISGYRAVIVGGTDNRIIGATTGYGVICGGIRNRIEAGEYNAIVGGYSCTINSTEGYNFQFGNNLLISGGAYNTQVGINHITSGGYRSALIGGQSNQRSAGSDGAGLGGENNTQTATRSIVLGGSACDDNGTIGAVMLGTSAKGVKSIDSLVQGAGQFSIKGDAQHVHAVQRVQTTGASDNPSSSQYIDFDDSRKTVFTGTATVTAYNITTGEEAGWRLDLVCYWDGTNYRINGVASEPNMIEIYNPGAIPAPTIALNTGSFRIRFGGVTGETINQVAVISGVMVQVSN